MIQVVHSQIPVFMLHVHFSHLIGLAASDGIAVIKPAPIPTTNSVVMAKDFIIFPLIFFLLI